MNSQPTALPKRGRASLLRKEVYGGEGQQEGSAKPAGVNLVLLKGRETGLLPPQRWSATVSTVDLPTLSSAPLWINRFWYLSPYV